MYFNIMKLKLSDKIRNDYKIYLEPILANASEHQGLKLGISRSKYIRYAVIRSLIIDGYPLNKITDKFDKFYKCNKIK
jgi:hypothetical protein